MINIITYSGNDAIINDFEGFFDAVVSAKDFEETDLSVMSNIDHAKLLDKRTGAIETPFGVTDIEHLSTGCKVVLSYLYLRKNKEENNWKVFDITECGSNALEVLFYYVDKFKDDSTIFLLRHYLDLELCSDRDYKINGNVCKNLDKGMSKYGTDL